MWDGVALQLATGAVNSSFGGGIQIVPIALFGVGSVNLAIPVPIALPFPAGTTFTIVITNGAAANFGCTLSGWIQ